MEHEKILRINELAKKKKEIGLTDEEAEDCFKCLRDYAARMSRDELGQLSGEALRQYIENLNREKNRRKE